MLNLDSTITINESTIKSPNLCSKFSMEDLDRIGSYCHQGYKRDLESRRVWMKRNEAGMDLALQIQKEKSFPWPGCSAVAFPLVTVAAMQFHARAYPAIVNGTDIVKYRVAGPDPTGQLTAKAIRIGQHMSYQVLEEDSAWEEQQDRLLLNVSIIGTCFKKTYYSSVKGHNISEMVMAKDLVLNYWAKSVEDCERKTHILPMFRNEIHEKVLRGTFRDVLESAWFQSDPPSRTNTQQINSDNRQGKTPPQTDETTSFSILEQHVALDLDGDGYAEPYIVTFEEHTGEVLRIVTRFDEEKDVERIQEGKFKGKIVKIIPVEYFTKFTFIPSPDGGIYDVGFGVFLGPLNEAVNSLVNQLVDAGTMSNTAGGFLGRGAKIRGGVYQFTPFGWNRVDSTGDDLQKSIFPLPVREPSAVLFNLLGLLIQYTNRISGTTEASVGENVGQNTPATTMQSMVEAGQRIYAAIFKRVWRSEKEEFKKLYKLNQRWVPEQGQIAGKADYLGNPDYCVPSADPNIVSDHMRMVQAQALREAAMSSPGYDREAVERNFLRAMKIDGVDALYPGVEKTGPLPNPKMALVQVKEKDLELKKMEFIASLQEEQKLNQAKIIKLNAEAALAMEEAGGVKEGHQIALFEAQLGAAKLHSEHINSQIQHFMKGIELDQKQQEINKPQPQGNPGA